MLPKYSSICAFGLTPEELKASNISDKYLRSAVISFEYDGERYMSYHCSPKHNRNLYVRFFGDTPECIDEVAEVLGGVTNTNVRDRHITINSNMKLGKSQIAKIVEQYKQRFNEVFISQVLFNNVPDIELGLPTDKQVSILLNRN